MFLLVIVVINNKNSLGCRCIIVGEPDCTCCCSQLYGKYIAKVFECGIQDHILPGRDKYLQHPWGECL